MSGRLVLHADDFGMSRAVSNGVLRGFQQGLLTSTAVLANAPDADDTRAMEAPCRATGRRGTAVAAGPAATRRQHQPFDLGVHLNLTQGRPLGRYPAELLDERGCFPGVVRGCFRLWRWSDRFRAAIRGELERQIGFVCDCGLRPMHLNGHQYIEMLPAVAHMMPELMARFDIARVRVAWEPALLPTTLPASDTPGDGRWPG